MASGKTEPHSPSLQVAPTQTPYQLDLEQTERACKVLQKHIEEAHQARKTGGDKRDLFSKSDAPAEEDNDNLSEIPIEMILTSKKHISDRTRLKPYKIQLPNSLNKTSESTVCLIVADPQRLYKDTIADPAFQKDLQARITRVIGITKLKAKYKSFESRRQLLAEHDFFMADSRIITYLPKTLGKVFYRGHGKRPIPVEIGGNSVIGRDGKVVKPNPGQPRKSTKGTDGKGAANAPTFARELERALNSAIVHLSTSNTTAVKVATAAMTPAQCAANIQTIIEGITSRLLPGGWRNIRALHLKGPKSPSFPIWLANELWMDDKDVLEEKKIPGKKRKKPGDTTIPSTQTKDEPAGLNGTAKESNQLAKRSNSVEEDTLRTPGETKQKRTKRNHDNASETERKNKLRQQKADVLKAASDV